jgi:starch synthase (maltosyl-transferring)
MDPTAPAAAKPAPDPAPERAGATDADPGHGRPGGLVPPPTLSGRFGICDVWPAVESGRRPVKAAVGEELTIAATVFREGHDALAVEVVLAGPDGGLQVRRMHPVGQGMDRWETVFRFGAPGDWTFAIRAWHEAADTWRHRAEVKVPAGVDVELELEEGARLFDQVGGMLTDPAQRRTLEHAAAALRDQQRPAAARLAVALAPDVFALLRDNPLQDVVAESGGWPVRVERRRALFGSWYELFPRSEGASHDPPRSGTFADAARRLPAIAAMGFDVLYLPPIHPIGEVNRKGRNNTLEPGAGDPGSPWAIGSAAGGHDAVHPDLGTLADFEDFRAAAETHGLEIALDLALQAAPDHPWAGEHPEWFTTRADGTIAYAENPPKKYQDIYPLNFDNDPEGLYAEAERVVRFWMARGVRIFRVDNPHTKPLWVWDRLIGRINATDPDVLFLAEAFTRPPMMRALASVGFQQSYTYFTWRTGRQELTEYLEELSGPAAAYMRPNFFVNTPDILHEFLQTGGPAAFAIRATLAATMSPTWGVYSGFELFEHIPVRPGSEEYLDSEKYQYRPRDWDTAARHGHTLIDYITLLNRIRRERPALQTLRGITFHHTEDDGIIAFSKTDGDDTVIVVCTLDPLHARETTVWLDMPALGRDWHDYLLVTDEVSGADWAWHQGVYVRLDPEQQVAHIVRVRG